MSEVFDRYYETHFSAYNSIEINDYEYMAREYDANYGKFLPQNKDANILDVGCGLGHCIYYLKKLGYINVSGIDVSPQQVEICKHNVSEKVECISAFEFLKNNQNKYDLIILNDIIEHIPKEDCLLLVKLIHSSLSKKGIVIMKTGNMANVVSLRLRYIDFTHETGFTEESISQLLRLADFEKVSVFPFKYPKQQLNMSRSIAYFFITILSSVIIEISKVLYITQGIKKPKVLTLLLFCVGHKS